MTRPWFLTHVSGGTGVWMVVFAHFRAQLSWFVLVVERTGVAGDARLGVLIAERRVTLLAFEERGEAWS